jgi:Protein of unknown function (DUF998)
LTELNPRTYRALALCGIVAPVLFAAFVIVESLLRPDVSVREPMSDFAIGPYGALQTANFWITGILLLGFSVGLRAGLGPVGRAAKIAPILVGIYATVSILAGFVPTDLPGTPLTLHGLIHNVSGLISFVSLVAAIFLVRAAKRSDPQWGGRYSSISLILGLAAVIALLVAFALAAVVGFAASAFGVFQRLMTVFTFFWMVMTGAKMYQLGLGPNRR